MRQLPGQTPVSRLGVWRASQKQKPLQINDLQGFYIVAEWTGLEPATPGVTGRYSNQLNYHSW